MVAKPTRRPVRYNLLVLAVSITAGSPLMPGADLPTSPGLGFAMVGIAPGQTARINALNVGPGGRVLPRSGVETGSCGGGVTFEFYGAAGELLKKTVINNLPPGKTAFL